MTKLTTARAHLRELLTRNQPDVFGGAVAKANRNAQAGEYVASYPDGGEGAIFICWYGFHDEAVIGAFDDLDAALDCMLDLAPATRWRYAMLGGGALA